MEEVTSSSPPPTATAERKQEEASSTSPVKKAFLSFAVSLQEGFRYTKASVLGQAKQVTARNEKEATAAELQAQKMQVQAADQAENIKSGIK